MHLKVFNLHKGLHLFLLTEPCPIFYSVCLFFCDVDAQLSHQCFGDRPDGLGLFSFPFFAIFASRLSSVLFTRSLHSRLLILAPFTTF